MTKHAITLSEFRDALRHGSDHIAALAGRIVQSTGRSHAEIIDMFARLGHTELRSCDWSNEFFYGNYYTTGNEEIISPASYVSDAFICDSCDGIYHNDQREPYRRDERCCEGCANRPDTVWHDGTEAYWPDDEVPLDDDNSGDTDHELVRGYSANVLRANRETYLSTPDERLPRNPRWLGVELEVEPKRGGSRNYIEDTHAAVKDFAILKEDSTLGNGGFEIVTVPATLRKQRELWEPFFAGPNKKLASWYTDGRCGMHVHIARDSMSSLTLGRMIFFVHEARNRSFIENVAGRSANDYTRFYKKKITDHHCSITRYEAVNITEKGTVELRIFRGNVAKFGFYKNLDFADALVAFCDSTSNQELGYRDFLVWLSQPANRAIYPYLTSWAVSKGMLDVKVKRNLIEAAA